MADQDIGEAIIPEEDFREAIAACCEDPQLKRYFTLAPPGAKLFIGLGFYSTHFGDKVDPKQYAECQAEIEPALSANDLKYLIRFEDDKNTKRYLRGLLSRIDESQEDGDIQSPGPSPAPGYVAIRRRKNRISSMQWLNRDDSSGWFPRFCKVAALIAIFPCAALLLFCLNADKQQTPPQVAALETQPTQQVEQVAAAVVQPTQEVEQVAAVAQPTQEVEQVAAAVVQPTQEVEQVVAVVPQEEQPVEQQTEHGADVPEQPMARRRPKVVFTDGHKIVRRPGGRIEVPRVFSSGGAGIKPFWVYGRNPEADAAKEKKARAEWSRLYELAQEGTGR